MYSYLFALYRDVIVWYMKHQVSKFFGSFNEDTKEKFSEAATEIDDCSSKTYRQADIAHLAMSLVTSKNISEIKTEVNRYCQELDEAKIKTGMFMREAFMATHRRFTTEQMVQRQSRPQIQDIADHQEINAD
ncbi:MAG: hypothetical protein Q9157_002555 [Trypethelium eluteriae]